MNQEEKLIVYGTPVCPMVPPVRSALKRASVAYEYIDIWQDDAARAAVRSINNGNESVPTLLFPDGSTLTEPNNRQLLAKLAALGIVAEPPSILNRVVDFVKGPSFRITAMALATVALISQNVTLGAITIVLGLLSYVILPYLDQ